MLDCRETTTLGPTLPFPDVHLGALLGQGSFGRVYRGMWNGAYVAVKVSFAYSDRYNLDCDGRVRVRPKLG